ncbi:MAG: hypothetical protein Q8S18_04375 [Bacteroidales bacterium]|nr:hypothetical protein [Bacteroidales bacterium]
MKTQLIKTILTITFVVGSSVLLAQVPPPPPGGGHGGGDNQPGGGAPIGSGIGILLALGAAYGGKKVYRAFKNAEKLEE